MDIYLLFCRKSPLTKECLPWLRGAFEQELTARRNSSGRAVVSAVPARSLLVGMNGATKDADTITAQRIEHLEWAWKPFNFLL